MKECKTSAVIGKTPAQVIPSANFVYGFVLDQFLQNESGRSPTETFQAQETSIKPGLQQVANVLIDWFEMRTL